MRGAGELAPFLRFRLPRQITVDCVYTRVCLCVQLHQALAGKFNAHVHVEYEWCLQHEDLDESDEDLDEKVRGRANDDMVFVWVSLNKVFN